MENNLFGYKRAILKRQLLPMEVATYVWHQKCGDKSMSFAVACPTCGVKLKVPDTSAGKVVKCPKCFGSMTRPATDLASGNSRKQPAVPPSVDVHSSHSYSPPPLVVEPVEPTQHDDEPAPRRSRPSRRRGPGVGFHCPFCRSNDPPQVRSKISTAGWVVFVVLLLFCFPLCIIGLFITENYRVCSSCGINLG